MSNDVNDKKSWHDSSGKFRAGNPGRPVGASRNKIRERLKSFIVSNLDGMQEYYDSLTPREKFRCLVDLMPFVVSKLQSVHMGDQDGNDLEPRIDFAALSESTLREILKHTKIENGI